jgi:uncharacterized lipoprotein YmbA
MTTSTRRRLIAVVLASATLAAGCSGSAQTRFYVLAPAEMAAVAAPALTVGLGPVGLAGYLDRPQIVTRPAADKIDLGEFDQWGEPLRSGISRVLAEDLARQMPSARIAIFPWRGLDQIRYQVVVDVTRLDGPTGGDLALEARWRIVDGAGKEVAVKITRVSEPTGAAGYSAMVSAMSRALAALSREMAQALSALPQ